MVHRRQNRLCDLRGDRQRESAARPLEQGVELGEALLRAVVRRARPRRFCRRRARRARRPLDVGVDQERLQHALQRLPVPAQHAEGELRDLREDPVVARQPERVHDVLGQPERDDLGLGERQPVPEDAVEVHVDDLAVGGADEDVLEVAVAEPDGKADHAHHGVGAREVEARVEPRGRLGERLGEEPPERGRSERLERLLVGDEPRLAGPGERLPDGLQGAGVAAVRGDRGAERDGVRHPLDDARVLADGDRRERDRAERAAAALRVAVEQPVHHRDDLHHAVVAPQVVLRLAEEVARPPVRALDLDLLRLHHRVHDLYPVVDAHDRRERLLHVPARAAALAGDHRREVAQLRDDHLGVGDLPDVLEVPREREVLPGLLLALPDLHQLLRELDALHEAAVRDHQLVRLGADPLVHRVDEDEEVPARLRGEVLDDALEVALDRLRDVGALVAEAPDQVGDPAEQHRRGDLLEALHERDLEAGELLLAALERPVDKRAPHLREEHDGAGERVEHKGAPEGQALQVVADRLVQHHEQRVHVRRIGELPRERLVHEVPEREERLLPVRVVRLRLGELRAGADDVPGFLLPSHAVQDRFRGDLRRRRTRRRAACLDLRDPFGDDVQRLIVPVLVDLKLGFFDEQPFDPEHLCLLDEVARDLQLLCLSGGLDDGDEELRPILVPARERKQRLFGGEDRAQRLERVEGQPATLCPVRPQLFGRDQRGYCFQ